MYEGKMAIENLNDGVGKKIVEALKMQADEATDENMITEEEPQISEEETVDESYSGEELISEPDNDDFLDSSFNSPEPPVSPVHSQSAIDIAFNNSLSENLSASYMSVPDDIEYPANVAVLRQLIAKLPAGVSKQTGALIIKQTMEALGISMSSVIQEAKQFQDMLSSNTKECQRNIVEYRKQIGILEAKTQQYQRQTALMNDIINLFVHTR